MSKTHHLPRRPHGVKAWLRRTAAIAAAALVGTTALVASGITSTPASATIPGLVAQAGTWYETAFAVWQGASDGDYRAYVQLSDGFDAYDWRTGDPIADPDWDMAAGWVAIDDELVRLIDPARGTWRVDVQGLPLGTYDLKVVAADDIEFVFSHLVTESFPRLGAAFVPSDELISNQAVNNWAPEGATGGYLADGRINPDSVVIYVAHEDWDDFTVANLQRGSELRGENPVVVRFLGTVGSFERSGGGYVHAGVSAPSGAMNNNRMMTLNGNSHEITFEGVGTDATIYGWGLFTGGSSNIVIRNLTIDMFWTFGIRASGTTSNIWVHHNDFGYGQNRMLFNDEPTDRTMGQGAMDIEQNVRGYTIGYNSFLGGRGTHLIVGGVQNVPLENNVNRHYGTLHHNLYQQSQERNPRTRHHNLHIFNNVFANFDGNPLHYRLMDRFTAYGIGAAHNATIWAEGNIFDEAGFPFLRSRHGHARGLAPHTGHNHFFGDGPGFMITGDNISLETGASLGSMTIPEFGADLGYRNDATGLDTIEQYNDFVAAVNALQPNVLDAYSASTFDPALDLGITVDEAATMIMPPADDVETAAGFPGLNGNANTHGWGFDGDFRPTTTDGVWPTGTLEEAAALRTEVETNAGAQRDIVATVAPVAPANVSVSLNVFEYMMHRQNSPLPSLRTITTGDTFTIAWSGEDAVAEAHEIGIFRDGEWQVLGSLPVWPRNTSFTTQNLTTNGTFQLYAADGSPVWVHNGAAGFEILHPSADFPGISPEDVPSVDELLFGPEWVFADLVNGGTYEFGVHAVNAAGHSDWAVTEIVVSPDQSRVATVQQTSVALPGEASVVEFELTTGGIADGTYDIALSVPRSQPRVTMPWPAQQNFTNLIRLPGTPDFEYVNGPVRGNGGVGTLEVVDGVATLSVEVAANVPAGHFDLVLTIEGLDRLVEAPINLIVGEFEIPAEPIESPFVDVDVNDQFFSYIAWLAKHGITTGWELADGTFEFRPGANVTREAMAAFIFRAAGSPEFELPETLSFVDVAADSPFLTEIEWLAASGIATGWTVAEGVREFRPGNNITRESMAAMLFRAAGSPSEFVAPEVASFDDVPVGSQFFTEVEWMAANYITRGWDDGTFRPGIAITREATAAFLYRAYGIGGGIWTGEFLMAPVALDIIGAVEYPFYG